MQQKAQSEKNHWSSELPPVSLAEGGGDNQHALVDHSGFYGRLSWITKSRRFAICNKRCMAEAAAYPKVILPSRSSLPAMASQTLPYNCFFLIRACLARLNTLWNRLLSVQYISRFRHSE